MSRLGERSSVAVNELSYGEQRQLELAMALVSSPRLAAARRACRGPVAERSAVIVVEIIRALPRDLTMVLIEHDMDLVLNLVDWRDVPQQRRRCWPRARRRTSARNQRVQDVYLGKARADA